MSIGLPLGLTGLAVGGGTASHGNISSQALPVQNVFGTVSSGISNAIRNATATTTSSPANLSIPAPVMQGSAARNAVAGAQSAITNLYPIPTPETVFLPGAVLGIPRVISHISIPIENVLRQTPAQPTLPGIQFTFALIARPQAIHPDELNVSNTTISNNKFVPVEANGITAFRPEIVSVIKYQPVYRGNSQSLTSVGKMIDVSYQARLLREETLHSIVKELEVANSTKNQFNDLVNSFQNSISSTEGTINFYARAIDEIQEIKKSLDIKDIAGNAFETPHYLTLIDFFEKKMKFPKTSFSIFSDTKILYQMVSDLREVIENYSFSLFDIHENGRQTDRDPVKINKAYQQPLGFRFSLDTIKSSQSSKNATDEKFFTDFGNSLPTDADNRIKLLLILLSKEMRVSKNLSQTDIGKTLLDNFNVIDVGNPFDNIIGVVGESIFVKPSGDKSLASVLTLDLGNNANVFPFEDKYIDNLDAKTTSVPGSNYFIDNILEVPNTKDGFNTNPFTQYIDLYSRKVNDTKAIIENLLELKESGAPLAPVSILQRFIASLRSASDGLVSSKGPNHDQAITVALYKLATTDRELKLMLFQFLCLTGISSLGSKDQKKIFERLAREFVDLRGLSYVKVSSKTRPELFGGSKEMYPYLEQLAKQIEERVLFLINGSTDASKQPLPTAFQKSPTTKTLKTADFAGSTNTETVKIGKNQTVNKGETHILTLKRGSVKGALLSATNATASSATNMIKEFVDIADRIEQAARTKGNPDSYVLSDGSGRTRYNQFSTSTILLLIFEICSNMVNKYTFTNFVKSRDHSDVTMEINTEATAFMQVVFDDFADKKAQNKTAAKVTTNKQANISAAANSVVTRNATGPAGSTALATSAGAHAISQFVSHNPGPSFMGSANAAPSLLLPNDSTFGSFARQSVSSIIAAPLNALPAYAQTAPIFSQMTLSPLLGVVNAVPHTTSILPRLATIIPLIPNLTQGIPDDLLNLKASVGNISAKIQDEDIMISNFLHIFSVIGNRLNQSKTRVQTFFNSKELNGLVSLLASANTYVTPQEQLKTLTNPEQVRTAAYLYKKILGSLNYHNLDNKERFLQSSPINKGIRNAMLSLCSEGSFREGELSDNRVKLVTVGIPSGMSKKLVERVSHQSINSNSFLNKQYDVIVINVYKRSQEFDDIIFKPQKFIFDLSVFPYETYNLNASVEEQFNRIVDRAKLLDFESLQNPKTINLETLKANQKYSFLRDDQKREMVRNHLISELLSLYIMLLTGIRVEEETFTAIDVSAYDHLTPQLRAMIGTWLKEEKRIDISDSEISALTHAKLPENALVGKAKVTDDILDIIKLVSYGNLAFNQKLISHKILTPKMFDRVFTLPIDIENFEVDVQKTLSTQSGKAAYEKNTFQNKISRITQDEKGKITSAVLKQRNKDDIIFEDYFVNIELVG